MNVRGDIRHAHRAAGGGRTGGRRAAAGTVRVSAAHRHVEDDRHGVVERGLPGRGAHRAFADAEVPVPVQVEGDRLAGWVRPVKDHGVRVVAALAAAAGSQAAADAVSLVARATGIGAAVDGAGYPGQRVDVLHDVNLAVLRPLAGAEHPEGRPVAGPAGRLLDRRGHFQLAAGGCPHVGTGRLDAAGGPRTAAAEHRDIQVAAAVPVDVPRRAGHGLDLAGAETGARAGVVLPLRAGPAARRTVEVVFE